MAAGAPCAAQLEALFDDPSSNQQEDDRAARITVSHVSALHGRGVHSSTSQLKISLVWVLH